MTFNDPRSNLEIAHLVLYSLAHDRFVHNSTVKIAQNDLDSFIEFLDSLEHYHTIVLDLKELLYPAKRIIDIRALGESSIKELIEVALDDFNKAVEILGDLLDRKYSVS